MFGRKYVALAVVVYLTTICLPGGMSTCTEQSCPQSEKCCELPGGGEGCCPYNHGVCCADGIHCCPFGSICDEEHGRCIGSQNNMDEFVFAELINVSNVSVSNEHCPDGSYCPGVSTCCMLATRHYGCCPYQYGVCCRDMVHCCPQGTYCNALGQCYRYQSENDVDGELQELEPAVIVARGCHGAQQKCASDQTCCDKRDGSVGCCPMEKAVCCEGLDACCPEGFVCSPQGCVKV